MPSRHKVTGEPCAFERRSEKNQTGSHSKIEDPGGQL